MSTRLDAIAGRMSKEGIAQRQTEDHVDLRWCLDQLIQLRAALLDAANFDMPRFAGPEAHQPSTFLDLLPEEIEGPLRRFLNEGEV